MSDATITEALGEIIDNDTSTPPLQHADIDRITAEEQAVDLVEQRFIEQPPHTAADTRVIPRSCKSSSPKVYRARKSQDPIQLRSDDPTAPSYKNAAYQGAPTPCRPDDGLLQPPKFVSQLQTTISLKSAC